MTDQPQNRRPAGSPSGTGGRFSQNPKTESASSLVDPTERRRRRLRSHLAKLGLRPDIDNWRPSDDWSAPHYDTERMIRGYLTQGTPDHVASPSYGSAGLWTVDRPHAEMMIQQVYSDGYGKTYFDALVEHGALQPLTDDELVAIPSKTWDGHDYINRPGILKVMPEAMIHIYPELAHESDDWAKVAADHGVPDPYAAGAPE